MDATPSLHVLGDLDSAVNCDEVPLACNWRLFVIQSKSLWSGTKLMGTVRTGLCFWSEMVSGELYEKGYTGRASI